MPEESVESRQGIIAECLEALEKGDLDTIELACTLHRDLAAQIRSVVQLATQLKQDAGSAAIGTGELTLVGRSIRQYRVLRELGRGGVGVVYEVHDSQLDRNVALKVLATHAATRQELQRFRREALALARTRHPHITAVHDVGVTEQGGPYFVMDLIRGASLDERLKAIDAYDPATLKRADLLPVASSIEKLGIELTLRVVAKGDGRTTVGEVRQDAAPAPARLDSYVAAVLRLGSQVADALDHAHQMGVVHRDVKPGNILLDANGEPHLVDFGLAFGVGHDSVTATRVIRGTPHYMAPEQLTGDRLTIGPRTDVYALGVTLYHCLALRPPFRGDSTNIVFARIEHGNPTRLRSLNRAVPRVLEAVIQKAMDRRPDRRYVSAAAFRDDLQAVIHGRPVQARLGRFWYRTGSLLPRNPTNAVAMGMMLALLIEVVAILIYSLVTG